MTPVRALATVAGSTILLGGLGGLAGFALGTLAPGYYRSVFIHGSAPDFDPVAVGIGQGLAQGAAASVVAGLFVVGLLCWVEVRRQSRSDAPGA